MARISTMAACLLLLVVGVVDPRPLRAQCCAPLVPALSVPCGGCIDVPNCPPVQAACGGAVSPIAAWETRRHLGALGLPVPFAAACGGGGAPNVCVGSCATDVCGGGCAADVCVGSCAANVCVGSCAANVCVGGCAANVCGVDSCGQGAGICDIPLQRSLQLADWQAAVRQGARNAAVRGFDGTQMVPGVCGSEAVRSIVHDTIVEGFNYAGQNGGGCDMGRFQDLIAAGVEDAIVEGLNRTTVVEPKADRCKKPLDSPSAPASSEKMPAPVPPPAAVPRPLNGEKTMRAKDLQTPVRTTALRTDAALVSWSHLPSREVSTLTAEDAPPALSDSVRQHYAGPQDAAAFSARYSDSRLVASGWIVKSTGVVPLAGSRGFLVLTMRGDSEQVEVWSHGVLLAEKCRYVQYFEDAKPAQRHF